MDLLKNPIEEMLKRYESEGKVITPDPVARDKAIAEINEKMAEFALEQRAYFNYSLESAKKVYLTF